MDILPHYPNLPAHSSVCCFPCGECYIVKFSEQRPDFILLPPESALHIQINNDSTYDNSGDGGGGGGSSNAG